MVCYSGWASPLPSPWCVPDSHDEPSPSPETNTHHQIGTTYILKRYRRERQTSEMFSTAGRSAKSGLVGSAVVSSWTWAATLLQSTGVCYRYGVSGPFWYASGATVQILLFATLAIQLKRKAPNAHTFLEVVRARYGMWAHVVFIVFGLMTSELPLSYLTLPRCDEARGRVKGTGESDGVTDRCG